MLLLFLAVIPTVILLFFIYKMDSYEKEPASLLAALFGLGVFSCIPAGFFESFGTKVLSNFYFSTEISYYLIYAFFVVALAEEEVKYLFTYLKTWHNKEFNFRFDGIVYAVFTSLGFATLENILYVFKNGIDVALLRAVLSVPGHCMFAIYMGYFYGNAKYYELLGDHSQKKKHMLLAYLVPVSLHGFYDFCLFSKIPTLILVFFIFVVALDVFAIIRVVNSSRENHALYMQNYSNVYGNVYVPNQFVPYYNMYGAQDYAKQLVTGFNNLPDTFEKVNPFQDNMCYQRNNPFSNAPQFQNGAQFSNTPQFQGNSQFSNAPQFQGNSQFSSAPQFQGNSQFSSAPQFQGNSQFSSAPQFQSGSQFSNTPQFQGNSQPQQMFIYCGNCGSICNIHGFRCPQCGFAIVRLPQ